MTRGGKPSEQGGGTRYGTAGASCPPEPAPGTQGWHRVPLPTAAVAPQYLFPEVALTWRGAWGSAVGKSLPTPPI